ncbi:amidase domain-containing protein [Mesomycoplasma ovipneumoniae]
MTKLFKLALGFIPVVAGSAGAVVYFSLGNSTLPLNQNDVRQGNLKVSTLAPSLANSQKTVNEIADTIILQGLAKDKKEAKNSSVSDLNIKKITEKQGQINSKLINHTQNNQINTPLTLPPSPKSNKSPKNIIILSKKAVPLTKIEKKQQKIESLPSKKSFVAPSTQSPKIQKSAEKPANLTIVIPKVDKNDVKEKTPFSPSILDSKHKTKPKNPPISSQVIVESEIKKINESQEKLPLTLPSDPVQNLYEQPIIQSQNQKPTEIVPKIESQEKIQNQKPPEELDQQKQEQKSQTIKNDSDDNSQKSNSSSPKTIEIDASSDIEIVDQMVKSMAKDPDLDHSFAYKLLDKYKFTKESQMQLFLEKLPEVKTNQAIWNLVTFWTASYASFYPNEASVSSVSEMWRNQIIEKLQLQTTGNNENISVITQTGGIFG